MTSFAWLSARFPSLANLTALTQGGQKLVFRATDAVHGEIVLKVIQVPGQSDAATREILAVKAVNSPRVPRIIDDGTLDTPLGQHVWIKEEFIDGDTARARLRTGPLEGSQVLALAREVLETLVLAEQEHIVHRDIKPENIIITPGSEYYLLDFGLARHLRLQSLTASTSPFGKFTPGYAPPEQFRNQKHDIDIRVDLFALGVTLYECATGVNPFTEGTLDPLVRMKRTESLALPAIVLPMASAGDFSDFLSSLTQKRRDYRPRSAREALSWINDIARAQMS